MALRVSGTVETVLGAVWVRCVCQLLGTWEGASDTCVAEWSRKSRWPTRCAFSTTEAEETRDCVCERERETNPCLPRLLLCGPWTDFCKRINLREEYFTREEREITFPLASSGCWRRDAEREAHGRSSRKLPRIDPVLHDPRLAGSVDRTSCSSSGGGLVVSLPPSSSSLLLFAGSNFSLVDCRVFLQVKTGLGLWGFGQGEKCQRRWQRGDSVSAPLSL